MLEYCSYTQQEPHYQTVSFSARAGMLLSSFSINDPETWARLARIEVTAAAQIQLLNCSRAGLEALNKAMGCPDYSIPLTEEWGGQIYGYITPTPNAPPIHLHLYSERSHLDKLLQVETHCYYPPRSVQEMVGERLDFNWIVQAIENIIPAYERFRRCHMAGIILRVIVESIEPPSITYGPGFRIDDVKPEQIIPGTWSFDLRKGFDFAGNRRMLDTTQIPNICVELPEALGTHSRVIIEQALPVRYQ